MQLSPAVAFVSQKIKKTCRRSGRPGRNISLGEQL